MRFALIYKVGLAGLKGDVKNHYIKKLTYQLSKLIYST